MDIMESPQPDTAWKRTGDTDRDQLHLYTSSEMYDCSFNVCGQDKATQLFKCHKVILGTASSVFQKILFDDSKAIGKDDPIPIENVSPEAFDLAMKYIYGRFGIFGSPSLLVQVYRFANEMKLVALLVTVEVCLMRIVKPAEIFEVIELYKSTENKSGLKRCWEVFNNNTTEALQSSGWLTVSPETVQEVLENDNLYVNELTLFAAVVEWGRARVKKESPDSEIDDSKVRTIISPLLKLVRFSVMDSREFAELCKTTQVLSTEEKLAIIMSLNLRSSEFMPKEFAGASQSVRKLLVVISLPYKPASFNLNYNQLQAYNRNFSSISFMVDKKARLVGLQVHAKDPTFETELKNVVMELSDDEGLIQSRGVYISGALLYQEKKYVRVRMGKDCVLAQNVQYTLKFKRPDACTSTCYSVYSLDSSGPIKSRGLTVMLYSNRTSAPFSKLVFELV